MNRRDAAVILALIAAALAAYLLTPRGGDAYRVTVAGDVYALLPARQAQTLRIEQENGCVNEITVDETGARMSYSNCHNQICVHTGTATLQNGRVIVCLPNRVVVEAVRAGGEDEIDATLY